MDLLTEIPKLLQLKINIEKKLDQLGKMVGTSATGRDGATMPRMDKIMFMASPYTAETWADEDYELTQALLRTTIKYYNQRLANTNTLLALAAKALEGIDITRIEVEFDES